MADHPGNRPPDGTGHDAELRPDPASEARPLLRLTILGVVLTVLSTAASRGLRSLDDAPSVVDGLATVLAVASVLLLVTTFGAAVLWVLVRFLSPKR